MHTVPNNIFYANIFDNVYDMINGVSDVLKIILDHVKNDIWINDTISWTPIMMSKTKL
jgi:hypothetical protein